MELDRGTDMAERKQRLAIFPGTFDPMTNGHLDIIRRGAAMFDRLIVAVGDNPSKSAMLSQEIRAEIIRKVTAGMSNVSVEMYTGLTVDYAKKAGAGAILRGLRNAIDLQHEFQMALTNRVVAGIETVFIMTSGDCAFISASLTRQIAQMGGDISPLVPPQVLPYVQSTRKK